MLSILIRLRLVREVLLLKAFGKGGGEEAHFAGHMSVLMTVPQWGHYGKISAAELKTFHPTILQKAFKIPPWYVSNLRLKKIFLLCHISNLKPNKSSESGLGRMV